MYNLIFLLVISCALCFFITKKTSKKINTNNDYFLMGRNLNFFPLSMTLFATMLGGGVLIGTAQIAYSQGWTVIIYPLGTLFGFIILGLGFGQKLRNLKINTIPEIFEHVYKSQRLREFAAIISTISFYIILVSQGIAIKGFFTTIGITNNIIFFILWGSFVAYTTIGGFKAVVTTDVFQAIFILLGLSAALSSLDINQVTQILEKTNSPISQNIPWSSWFLMPLCFILIGQDMGQRCFAAKNSKIIMPAALLAGLLLLFCAGVSIIFGLLAKELPLDSVQGASVLTTSVIKFTPNIISTIFFVVVVMTITSTTDSILCSISSLICNDFAFIRNIAQKKQLFYSRIITFILGISALIFTMIFDNVVDALMFSYELSISVLFISVITGLFFPKPQKNAAIASMISGLICFVIFRIIDIEISKEIITLATSFLCYCVVYLSNKIKTINTSST